MELIFLIAGHMVLCFIFVTKTEPVTPVLVVTERCTLFRPPLFLTLSPLNKQTGRCARGWEGRQPTWPEQTTEGDIAFQVSCSKVKKESEPSFVWELSGHQSAHGRWWLPLHHLFCFLSLSLKVFLLLLFLSSSLVHPQLGQMSRRLCGALLPSGVEATCWQHPIARSSWA